MLGIETESRRISRKEIYGAVEAFSTATYSHVAPILEIDWRQIGNGEEPGEITQRLRAEYLQTIAGKNDAYEHWIRRMRR